MEEQSANGGGENHETSGHAGASSEAEQRFDGVLFGDNYFCRRENVVDARQACSLSRTSGH